MCNLRNNLFPDLSATFLVEFRGMWGSKDSNVVILNCHCSNLSPENPRLKQTIIDI